MDRSRLVVGLTSTKFVAMKTCLWVQGSSSHFIKFTRKSQ